MSDNNLEKKVGLDPSKIVSDDALFIFYVILVVNLKSMNWLEFIVKVSFTKVIFIIMKKNQSKKILLRKFLRRLLLLQDMVLR